MIGYYWLLSKVLSDNMDNIINKRILRVNGGCDYGMKAEGGEVRMLFGLRKNELLEGEYESKNSIIEVVGLIKYISIQ